MCIVNFQGEVFSQGWFGESALGCLNYQGELRAERFTVRGMRPSLSLGVGRDLTDRWSIATNVSVGSLTGQDAENRSYLTRRRNLHFATRLFEWSVMARIGLLRPRSRILSPYLTLGAALFSVNPYTYDRHGIRYHLYDLALEGQGLSAYPMLRRSNELNSALPVGAGLQLRLTDRLRLDAEFCSRKTFSDQLDGVSGAFPREDLLLAAHGSIAVDLSYRADELPGEDPSYPPEGTLRGNPLTKDWYYGVSIRMSWALSALSYDYDPSRRRLIRPRGWPYRW